MSVRASIQTARAHRHRRACRFACHIFSFFFCASFAGRPWPTHSKKHIFERRRLIGFALRQRQGPHHEHYLSPSFCMCIYFGLCSVGVTHIEAPPPCLPVVGAPCSYHPVEFSGSALRISTIAIVPSPPYPLSPAPAPPPHSFLPFVSLRHRPPHGVTQ